jgi:hypothetical protein
MISVLRSDGVNVSRWVGAFEEFVARAGALS